MGPVKKKVFFCFNKHYITQPSYYKGLYRKGKTENKWSWKNGH